MSPRMALFGSRRRRMRNSSHTRPSASRPSRITTVLTGRTRTVTSQESPSASAARMFTVPSSRRKFPSFTLRVPEELRVYSLPSSRSSELAV